MQMIHDIKNSNNSREKNNLIKKTGRGSEQTSFQGDIQMANMHTKRSSTSLIMKEMPIKTTVRDLSHWSDGYYQKDNKEQVLARMWRKRNPACW